MTAVAACRPLTAGTWALGVTRREWAPSWELRPHPLREKRNSSRLPCRWTTWYANPRLLCAAYLRISTLRHRPAGAVPQCPLPTTSPRCKPSATFAAGTVLEFASRPCSDLQTTAEPSHHAAGAREQAEWTSPTNTIRSFQPSPPRAPPQPPRSTLPARAGPARCPPPSALIFGPTNALQTTSAPRLPRPRSSPTSSIPSLPSRFRLTTTSRTCPSPPV